MATLGAAWRAVDRYVIASAGTVIARHLDGLTVARSRGFDEVGVVSASNIAPALLPGRMVARIRLGLPAPV